VRRFDSNLVLLVLLLAVALVLAACAGSDGEAQESAESNGAKESMDHGDMTGMTGTEASEGMASRMVAPNGEYSDERFIDAMVPHHQGAIDMANVALQNAEHPEIQELAQNITASQQAEIDELKSIKQREFGTSEVPMEMSPEHMQMMGLTENPNELATQRPFDKVFIDHMIPHHESAIEMANVVLEQSQNPELRQIAGAIVEAQQMEIEQMRSWRDEWYPES
jgi:uncharacterized protein (DUF305 family)